MTTTVVYDNTGKILGCATKGAYFHAEGLRMDHDKFIQPNDYYVDLTTNSIKQKVEMPLAVSKTTMKADSKDTVYIADIPSGAECFHDDESYVVTDGLIEFTADHDGTYSFRFELFPYLDTKVKIEAVSS